MPAICLEEVAEISSIDCICKPEYSVERRHNSVYSQRIPTDWANRRCCGDARVVHEIPWSNDIITSNVGFLGDSVVEELGLINYTVFCRVGKNLGDVSIKIFFCHLYRQSRPTYAVPKRRRISVMFAVSLINDCNGTKADNDNSQI